MSSSFKSGKKTTDNLLSSPWSSTANQTFKTLRRMNLDSTLDFESKSFSILLPRSLQVLSNAYFRVELPELSQSDYVYKKSVGKYIFSNFRLLSSGGEVYNIPSMKKFYREFQEGLSEEDHKAFCDTHLGGHGTRTHLARVVYLPVPLMHSRYCRYALNNRKTYGVLPAKFGNSTVELVVDVNNRENLVLNDAHAGAISIAGKVSLEFREVVGVPALIRTFSDGRGTFSCAFPESTRLLPAFVQFLADTPQVISNINPSGAVFQIEIYAVNNTVDQKNHENDTVFKPTSVKVSMDNEVVINLADKTEVDLDEYSHGYKQCNSELNVMSRIEFNSCGHKSTYSFYGAIDCRSINQVEIELTFDSDCKVMLYQRRYSRITISGNGRIQKYLD